MNAREQPSIAPLFAARARGKRAAQHDALGLERQKRGARLGRRQPERRAEHGLVHRPEDRDAAAQKLHDRRIARPGLRRACRRRRDGRVHGQRAREREDLRQPLGRRPDRVRQHRAGDERHPSGTGQRLQPRRPRWIERGLGGREESGHDERVVQFVGIARVRPGLARHTRDGVARRARRARRRPTARSRGASAPRAPAAPRAARRP